MMIQKGTGQMDKVPESRFNIDAHFHENNDRPGSFAVKGGYFLHETLKEFDPNFVSLSSNPVCLLIDANLARSLV